MRGHRLGQPGQLVHRGRHVHGVERTGDASGISRARAGGFSASAASCSIVPAATICPLPLLLAAVRPCASMAASTSSGLPPITAVIDVGVTRAGRRHRPTALADEHHRLLGGEDTDAGRGGDLADGVAGGDTDDRPKPSPSREQLQRGQQTGGDEQRLRHGGVADGVGVGLGAVVARGPARRRRRASPAARRSLLGQPGCQEPGGLCALTGRDDGQHDLDYFVTLRLYVAQGHDESPDDLVVGI